MQCRDPDVAAIQAGTWSLRCREARIKLGTWHNEFDNCGPGAGAEGCRCDLTEPEIMNLFPWQMRRMRSLSNHISSVLSLLYPAEIAIAVGDELCI